MPSIALPVLDEPRNIASLRPVHPYRLPEPHAMVESVEAGSIAAELGITPGDEILTINGRRLEDVIDYRFLIADENIEITVAPGGDATRAWAAQIEKHADETLGVQFVADLFDGIRICTNNCDFCFVYQNRSGMRKGVYIKDDDYRLSFLHGDFITLTNLREQDWQRILEYRLSPLYVSVHATDPEARIAALRNPDAGRLWEHLGRLLDGGIEVHTQIVLTPGLNGGDILVRTVEELAAAHTRGVSSLAIVPVGLTRFRERLPGLRCVNAAEAREVVRRCRGWQRRFLRELGTRFVFVSDEMFLLAGLQPPGSATYEGFPQYQNGVGMIASLRDEWRSLERGLPEALLAPRAVTVVTGALAGPALTPLALRLSQIEGLDVRVRPILNEYFGDTVTVAGLVCGQDVIEQLQGERVGEALILPDVALRDDLFMDDVSVSEVSEALDVPVVVAAPTARGLRDACLGPC